MKIITFLFFLILFSFNLFADTIRESGLKIETSANESWYVDEMKCKKIPRVSLGSKENKNYTFLIS